MMRCTEALWDPQSMEHTVGAEPEPASLTHRALAPGQAWSSLWTLLSFLLPPQPQATRSATVPGHWAGWAPLLAGRTPLCAHPHPGPQPSVSATHIWGSKDQVTSPGCRPHQEQLTGLVPRPFKAKESLRRKGGTPRAGPQVVPHAARLSGCPPERGCPFPPCCTSRTSPCPPHPPGSLRDLLETSSADT